MSRNLWIAHGYDACGIGNITPVIFVNARQLYVLDTVVNIAGRKERYVRAIETASEENWLAVFDAKLIGDPRGYDMIGEIRFFIILGAKVPSAMPFLWLVLNFFVKSICAFMR